MRHKRRRVRRAKQAIRSLSGIRRVERDAVIACLVERSSAPIIILTAYGGYLR
jgi:hypothetical protein